MATTIRCKEAICTQEVTHVEEADELLELVSQVPTTKDAQSTSTAYQAISHHSESPSTHEVSHALGAPLGDVVRHTTL